MVNILIQGGNGETAARDVSAAIHEIFGFQPSRIGGASQGVRIRGAVEAALIVLAVPPAIIAMTDIAQRSRFMELIGSLIARASKTKEKTRSSILIDLGDGRHVPLDEASHGAIVAALTEMETRLKDRSA